MGTIPMASGLLEGLFFYQRHPYLLTGVQKWFVSVNQVDDRKTGRSLALSDAVKIFVAPQVDFLANNRGRGVETVFQSIGC